MNQPAKYEVCSLLEGRHFGDRDQETRVPGIAQALVKMPAHSTDTENPFTSQNLFEHTLLFTKKKNV